VEVFVCAGGGRVGRTTALAWQGKNTLAVTVDPARGLADAVETPIGSSRGVLARGRKRVEGAMGRVLSVRAITDANLFLPLPRVRERVAFRAREAEELLLGETTVFVLVAAPTGAAAADLENLARKRGATASRSRRGRPPDPSRSA
jgi:hypothetical protein